MRILLIHDIDSFTGGGAEMVVMNTKAGLEAAGHKVKILAGETKSDGSHFADYIFKCPDSNPLGKLFTYLYNPFAKRAVKTAIKDFNPDVIHLHTITRLSPAGILATSGTPTVLTLHDYGLLYPRLHNIMSRADFCGYGNFACCTRHAGYLRYYFEYFRTYMIKQCLKHVSYFIGPTDFIKKAAEQLGFTPATVVHNPIITHGEPKINKLKNAYNLLYVGRLEPEKGVIQLAEIFKLVHSKIPSAKLYIAGDGSLKNYLIEEVRAKELSENVFVLGFAPPKERDKLYKTSRIFVMPSLWPEPYGLVGLEAMSHGVPVVGSGRGGMDWLKDGVNGLVANPEDLDAFSDAIIQTLTNTALYKKFVFNARKTATDRTLESYASRLTDLYKKVLAIK